MPAHGRNYCPTCSRYFVTEQALATHSLSKDHKRRCAACCLSSQPIRRLYNLSQSKTMKSHARCTGEPAICTL